MLEVPHQRCGVDEINGSDNQLLDYLAHLSVYQSAQFDVTCLQSPRKNVILSRGGRLLAHRSRRICGFFDKTLSPLFAQVHPCWVFTPNQLNFLFPSPALKLFLTGNSRSRRRVSFKPNQPIAMIGFGKSPVCTVSMLRDATLKIASNSDIESMRAAGNNVRIVSSYWHAVEDNRQVASCRDAMSNDSRHWIKPQILRLRGLWPLRSG